MTFAVMGLVIWKDARSMLATQDAQMNTSVIQGAEASLYVARAEAVFTLTIRTYTGCVTVSGR